MKTVDKRSIEIEARLRGAAAQWRVYAEKAIAPTQMRYCQEISNLFEAGADEISRLRAGKTLNDEA